MNRRRLRWVLFLPYTGLELPGLEPRQLERDALDLGVAPLDGLGLREANSKLSQMVCKQTEAEQRKRLAEELTVELQRQNEQIRVRREQVETELSEAEPALVAAKHSVQNIRKAQLDEVRALARPPNAVRLTMEMVSIMIGEKS